MGVDEGRGGIMLVAPVCVCVLCTCLRICCSQETNSCKAPPLTETHTHARTNTERRVGL